MSSKIKVEIFCTSNSIQLQLIYTGFRMLEQQGLIELSYEIYRNRKPDPDLDALAWPPNLLVRLNGTTLLLFDMNDNGELWLDDLPRVNFYFKRSFSASTVGPALAYRKVFPFGLNYQVYERTPSWFSLRRVILEENLTDIIKSAAKTLGWLNLFSARNFHLDVGNAYAKPDRSLSPGVIFMTRLWNPEKYSAEGRQLTQTINNVRINCIRKLRREFGPRCLAGLAPERYLPAQFADCLLPDFHQSHQGNYLQLLKKFPIGVATTGLANSIGYKFAEYIAFSRAIVSERLHFESPGLLAGKHYLEFDNADDCVERVSTLMNDDQLCMGMMEQNYAYYQEYLRPDVSVMRALTIALA